MEKTHEPGQSKTPLPVEGAFEIHDGTKEELITLTRDGRLLEVGDQLPHVPGVVLEEGPFILHTVNEFGTETCDKCVDTLEQFHKDHGIPVYSLGKQNPEKDLPEDEEITHKRFLIDNETAIDLGAALEPGKDADKDFWPTALRRMVVVADKNGKIVHIQHPNNQEQKPNFDEVIEKVLAISE